MSQPGSPQRPAPVAEAMKSSPGTDQGDTPKKERKKKSDKKPIPVMKFTVDVQQWLRKENDKAVKVKITDLKIDKTKERGDRSDISTATALPRNGRDTKHFHPLDRCA